MCDEVDINGESRRAMADFADMQAVKRGGVLLIINWKE